MPIPERSKSREKTLNAAKMESLIALDFNTSIREGERTSGFGVQLTQMAMFLIFWVKRAVTRRLPGVSSPDWLGNSVNHASS